uniref:Lipase_3 domain-containing protein n=1 Tax=Parastrongyloides trichosuri TaxID=131310 RepID=A0A0N4ZAC6_PARTI
MFITNFLQILIVVFFVIIKIKASTYDETLALVAYNLSASAYADDDESNIKLCLQKSYPNKTITNIHHSSFQCDDSNGDTCGGVFANFPEIDTTIIAFRGTKQSLELIKEAIESLESFDPYNCMIAGVQQNCGYVNKYYKHASEVAYKTFIQDTLNDSPLQNNIVITGHSLGGAMATLLGLQLVSSGRNANNITVITFGEPRIGDYVLSDVIRNSLPNLFRVTHYQDIVPHYPPCKSDDNNGCKKISGKPYHHPTEIWYNKYEKMTKGVYVTCNSVDGEYPPCKSDDNNGCKKISGKPYHHPTEIWYNKYEKMTKGVYVTCNSVDGEDNDCSDKYFSVFQSLFNGGWESEHMDYFGYNIHTYALQGCNISSKIRMSILGIILILVILFVRN